jgi:AcrR family transcriptional regulator
MPRVLSEADVADFRERLCEAAERLFAEQGPDAVTMRQLAAELGVSPMTPYRYFRDKDDILAAVRTTGFNRFAEALERARARETDPRAKGAAVGAAYVEFAFQHRHTYKLMFDLNQPNEADYPELVAAGERARATMSAYVKDLVAEGMLAGDPEQIGMMFWAATHGLVVLELAGKLPPGATRDLSETLGSALARGLHPDAVSAG